MAILTWQNIPVPDIGNSHQQATRTAGDLLNRAVGNATAAVDEQRKLEEAQKLAQVQTADKFALQQALAIQDPAQYEQQLAQGTIAGPAQAQMSPDMMLQLEARQDDLRKRSDAATTRANSAEDRKFSLNKRDYEWDRQQNQDQAKDDASAVYAAYGDLAVTNPEDAIRKAGAEMKTYGVPLESQMEVFRNLRQLYLDRTGMINASTAARRARLDEMEMKDKQLGVQIAQELRAVKTPEERATILAKYEKNYMAMAHAETFLQGKEGNATQNYFGSEATMGLAPAPFESAVAPETALAGRAAKTHAQIEIDKTLAHPTAKIVLNAEPFKNMSQDQIASTMAEQLKKSGREDANVGTINKYLTKGLAAAREHKVDITEAEVAGLLWRQVTESSLVNIDDLAENIDVDEGNFLKSIKDIAGGRTAAAAAKKIQANTEALTKMEADISNLKTQRDSLLLQVSAGKSGAADGLERVQERLRKKEAEYRRKAGLKDMDNGSERGIERPEDLMSVPPPLHTRGIPSL